MKLADGRLKQLDRQDLSPDERASRRCQLAAELIDTGQYEAARDALGGLWQGIGKGPEPMGLQPLIAAEVMLQCGVLSGWLGSVRQIPRAQEIAKDLLTEALRRFLSQGNTSKVAEAQYELGMCYFRLGAYDEARVVLKEALKGLEDTDIELKAKTHIRLSHLEVYAGRYHDAWDVLKEAQPFFESFSDAIKGRWHGQLALVLRRLSTAEGRSDYVDRAIIEYEAAAYHLEQAKHERYSTAVLNNLAFLLYKLRRYREAHENLDRAARFLRALRDDGLLAQVNETRARVLVAEAKHREANRIIGEVVTTLEKGGEHALLADALTIQGVIWARTGMHESSLKVLRRALTVAVDAGATSNAAHAALTLIEEHGLARLSESDLYRVYRHADDCLKGTQDAEDIARLRACARMVADRLSGVKISDPQFSLSKAVLSYEARFIEQALIAERGSVTRAAKRLGMTHQTLGEMLKSRHKKLLRLRSPLIRRRRGVFKKTP